MLEKLPESIGHALIHQRAGMEQVVYNGLYHSRATSRMEVYSIAFAFNGKIPEKYTADGAGLSPPLSWSGAPQGAASLVLIVEDADSPTPHPLVHAIVVDLKGDSGSLAEGAMNRTGPERASIDMGQNSLLTAGWLPPDPPRGHGVHRYVFQMFALADGAAFTSHPGRGEVIEALNARALASGALIGVYERGAASEAADIGVDTGAPVLAAQ